MPAIGPKAVPATSKCHCFRAPDFWPQKLIFTSSAKTLRRKLSMHTMLTIQLDGDKSVGQFALAFCATPAALCLLINKPPNL